MGRYAHDQTPGVTGGEFQADVLILGLDEHLRTLDVAAAS